MDTAIGFSGVMQRMKLNSLLKPAVFLLCLLPLLSVIWRGFQQDLGANPAETLLDTFADWALYLLLLTLAVTPLRKLAGWNALVRIRRMLGLYVFFYASLHLLSYIWFDQYFDWNEIINDIIKRPFITLGFACFILLIPLAATSNKAMISRLKGNWKRLHQLVYPIAIMAVVHYFLMTRADFTQPIIVALILGLLLGYRIKLYLNKQSVISQKTIRS